jgi:hypothetical protein
MDLAAEMEAAFEVACPLHAPELLVLAVLDNPDLVSVILSFVSRIGIGEFGAVCRTWDAVEQRALRRASVGLLGATLPSAVATAVERELWSCCGRRAGAGAYNARLRCMLSNLRSNSELRERVAASAAPAEGGRAGPPSPLSPRAFVSMESAEMASAEQRGKVTRLLEQAAEAAQRREPTCDVSGLYLCECGCARQYRRRVLRQGGDVTKFSETLVCVDCKSTVGNQRPLFELGSALTAR